MPKQTRAPEPPAGGAGGGRPSWWNRELLVAFTAAVACGLGFLMLLHWTPLAAVLGGASMGVIWWSVGRSFRRAYAENAQEEAAARDLRRKR